MHYAYCMDVCYIQQRISLTVTMSSVGSKSPDSVAGKKVANNSIYKIKYFVNLCPSVFASGEVKLFISCVHA